jgi:hypothetical protein
MPKQNKSHPEWAKVTSLTAVADRDPKVVHRVDQSQPPLTEPEVDAALAELNDDTFVKRFKQTFTRVERSYNDVPPPMQTIGLVSFTPAKGARPNKNGVFGFAKLRGNYSNEAEANQRAEYLIRHVSSFHKIYHTFVGRPFPMTMSSDYSAEVSEIEMQKDAVTSISESIKCKRDEERYTNNEIKTRQKALYDESEKAKLDDGTGPVPDDSSLDFYITTAVKAAQTAWFFQQHMAKIRENSEKATQTQAIYHKAVKCMADLDLTHPEYKQLYYDKYIDARADLTLDTDSANDNFLKYMLTDTDMSFMDAEVKG